MNHFLTNQTNNSSFLINENSVKQYMNEYYEVAGLFLRLNNDINQILYDDRSILLHTAADNLTCLSGLFNFYHLNLNRNHLIWNCLNNIYGNITMKYHRWATSFAEADLIIFKLFFALFSFSTNSRIFHQNISYEYTNIKQILDIENKYVQLIWKYLNYKYGYQRTITKFISIIQWFLAVTVFMSYAHSAQTHRNDIESLIQQTELTFLLDDIEKIT